MKQFSFTWTCVLAATLAASELAAADQADKNNTLTAEQKQEGWQRLFDGKSLEGWNVRSGYATYRVEDGAVVGTTAAGSPNTFLVTGEEYGDFELRFQVKLRDNELNSGVQIRSKLQGDDYGGRVHGPQVEIEGSPGQAGFIYGEALGTGWLSPQPDAKDPAVNQHSHFKNHEWNDFRVRAVGGKIKTWINGHEVADLQLPKEVAANHAQGLIGLQVHGVGDKGPFEVRWRNIYLKKLEK